MSNPLFSQSTKKGVSQPIKIGIVVGIAVLVCFVIITYFVVLRPSISPDINSVQIVNWQPKWTGNMVNVANARLQELQDPEYSLDPSVDVTIKNPTQYYVYIKLNGQIDVTIFKNGNNIGDFSATTSNTFTIPPYSNDVYSLNMPLNQGYPSGYIYLRSDSMNASFKKCNVSELYRGTTMPP